MMPTIEKTQMSTTSLNGLLCSGPAVPVDMLSALLKKAGRPQSPADWKLLGKANYKVVTSVVFKRVLIVHSVNLDDVTLYLRCQRDVPKSRSCKGRPEGRPP